CSLLVFLSIVSALRHGCPEAVIAAGALLGAAAMSILGSPTAHPIVSLTVAVWVFACGTGAAGGASAATAARSWRAWLAAAVAWLRPSAWAGGTAWKAAGSRRPPRRALTIGWPYNYGFSDATTLDDGAQQRWVAHRAVAVVETRGSRLVLTFRPGP